jgi:release factor glutamine methyltransferase
MADETADPDRPDQTATFSATGRDLRGAVLDGERRLAAAGVPSPRVDAELLAAHVMELPRGRLLLGQRMTTSQSVRYESLIARRMARIPLQHLTGWAPFRELVLHVGPGVLVPRPETEVVADSAITWLRRLETPGRRTVVDLGSGSGAIAFSVAIECDHVDVVGLEIDPVAQEWARRNLSSVIGPAGERDSTILLRDGDITGAALEGGALFDLVGRCDVVISNPPYIPDAGVPRDPEVALHDPKIALYGGPDGFDVVRETVDTAMRLLRPEGLFVIEHADSQGDGGPDASLPQLLRTWEDPTGRPAWVSIFDRNDYTGRSRFTTALRRARGQ